MSETPTTQPTATSPTMARFAAGLQGNYDLVVAAFCGLLLISNIGATKLIGFPTGWDALPVIITDGGAFLFPLTYILGDVLAEVYGLRKARRAIIAGFVLAGIASLTFWLVSVTPPAPDWGNQEAWQAVLGFVPRIVLASLLGFLAGQFLNAYVLVKIKQATREKSLWARLIGSTVIGELADTAVFCVVAFGGVVSGPVLINYIITGYLYKVAIEVLLLPLTYAVIRAVKKREPEYRDRSGSQPAVRQLRLVVAADEFDQAVDFYRDRLGLVEEEFYTQEAARVMILGAGRATLELSNAAQRDLIDTVEVGRPGVAPPMRVCFEVDDAAAVTADLTAAGGTLIAAPTLTPWHSLNARLDAPAGVQLTIFTELGPSAR
ncbi:MAG TPA: queuosine precursor transporter [Microlunatus sp.]